jgi:hypothetical protein
MATEEVVYFQKKTIEYDAGMAEKYISNLEAGMREQGTSEKKIRDQVEWIRSDPRRMAMVASAYEDMEKFRKACERDEKELEEYRKKHNGKGERVILTGDDIERIKW